MALHSTANEFFTLLASETVPVRIATPLDADRNLSHLPPALESEIETSPDWGKTAWSAAKVDFERNEAKNLASPHHLPLSLHFIQADPPLDIFREVKLSLELDSDLVTPSFQQFPILPPTRQKSSQLAKPTNRPSHPPCSLSRTSPIFAQRRRRS